jgi:hypothetical protein
MKSPKNLHKRFFMYDKIDRRYCQITEEIAKETDNTVITVVELKDIESLIKEQEVIRIEDKMWKYKYNYLIDKNKLLGFLEEKEE